MTSELLREAVLRRLGCTTEEATRITTHLVDALMWGHEFAGFMLNPRPERSQRRPTGTSLSETFVRAGELKNQVRSTRCTTDTPQPAFFAILSMPRP
jgi:hypothetical protein